LIGFFSGGIRNEDARSGTGFAVNTLNNHAICERTKVHKMYLLKTRLGNKEEI
jgi:hypothetical protein